jgi:hypothetical protein
MKKSSSSKTTPAATSKAAGKTTKAAAIAAPAVKSAKLATTPSKNTKSSKASAPKVPKAPKASRVTPTVTKVVATIDVGFGNSLTIRGEGPGLSWHQGVSMVCQEGTTWVWSTTEAIGPVSFKLLANDQTWCAGEDLIVHPGETVTITPAF